MWLCCSIFLFFFQAEDGIRDRNVTGVQTCALPISMGFGLPAAIGAALAEPERTVVCFSGDGSILMNLQEFATAAEQRANVKVVLMNNRSLGLVYQQQTLFYGRRTFASEYAHVPDFV